MKPEVYVQRIEQVRDLMRRNAWDAVIISGSDPHGSEYPAPRWKQVEWICGFTGEAGDVVITLDHAGLWTDTRYFIQAVRQLAGTGVELHKTRIPGEVRIPEWLASVAFPGDRRVSIAFDGLCQMYSDIQPFQRAFGGGGCGGHCHCHESRLSLHEVPDILEQFWTDRPAVPNTPIIELPTAISGESRNERLNWLRGELSRNGCDGMLVTSLDEIAWLLNVRGSDVEYNPVVISYLLVKENGAVWYVSKENAGQNGVLSEVFEHLEADSVEIRTYGESVGDTAWKDLCGSNILVDTAALNFHLFNVIYQSGVALYSGKSPIKLRKAIKNESEVEGMRKAHFLDGLAMEKFLYWIDTQLSSGNRITEWDASEKIDALRRENEGFFGNSFQTISAYGAGAALPHYVTPHENAPVLEPHGLYLCDSGGQYLFGTTDLTRTVPLGECTELEKADYTIVLKGHIGLAKAAFPAGTSGSQIDYAARGPMWRYARDFGHGTGHGVGFFLNVHEGPQEIRHNHDTQPILPGMITSDEPGIYREGQHGVRHENLLLCKKMCTNEFGDWYCFENLTLCHIDTSAVDWSLLDEAETAWLNEYNSMVYGTLAPHLPENVASWLREKTRPHVK